jgi:hypothetical protein
MAFKSKNKAAGSTHGEIAPSDREGSSLGRVSQPSSSRPSRKFIDQLIAKKEPLSLKQESPKPKQDDDEIEYVNASGPLQDPT